MAARCRARAHPGRRDDGDHLRRRQRRRHARRWSRRQPRRRRATVRLLHRVDGERGKAASAAPSSRASGWLGGPGCASWTVTCSTRPRPSARCWRAPRPANAQIVVASRFCDGRRRRCVRTRPADAVQRLRGGRPHHVPSTPARRDRSDERVLPRPPRRSGPRTSSSHEGSRSCSRSSCRHLVCAAAEVPFVFGERHHGESKAGIREGLRYLRPAVGPAVVAAWHGAIGKFGLVGASGLVVNMVALAALPGSPGCTTCWRPCSRRRCPPPGTTRSRRAGSSADRAGRHGPLQRA